MSTTKFMLTCHVTVSAYTEVEAETLEQAIAEAGGRDVVLGGATSGEDESVSWLIEDVDGEPQNIRDAEAE